MEKAVLSLLLSSLRAAVLWSEEERPARSMIERGGWLGKDDILKVFFALFWCEI